MKEQLHPDLIRICDELEKIIDFKITCAHRTEEEQNKAFKDGFSKLQYPKSKHNTLPSMAMDLAPLPINYNNIARFHYLAGMVMAIAHNLDIKIQWGGNWKSIVDLPHFELI